MNAMESEMARQTKDLTTKADKIRALGRAGFARADIARYLNIRYQHVRNTLEAAGIPMPGKDDEAREPGVASNASMAEAPAPFEAALADGYHSLWIAADGRLVVPQALRDAMLLDEDGRVTAYLADGELRLISPRAALRNIQSIAAKYKKPGESVVDSFLAERRAMWGEE
jgi:hypothetical protein